MISLNKPSVFEGERGERLYKKAFDFTEKLSMRETIEKGVLVGFSGGPDSIFLLEFLNEYKKREKLSFKILAVHVNHSIRGDEADADEAFSSEYAAASGVEFISRKVDAKAYATENKLCLEEAARILRYSIFNEIIQGRNDISAIVIAHNANDNFETVLFNMTRGSGLRGILGIAPTRENIIRPILNITKAEIVNLLEEHNVTYACDSTNFSCDYSRNYIRHELIPRFSRLNDNPVDTVTRLSETLRQDNDFIEKCAKEFYLENSVCEKIPVQKLQELHAAVKTRVISYLAKQRGISLERIHISNIIELLPSGNFKVSLPQGYEFVSEGGLCCIAPHVEFEDFSFKLKLGENKFEEFDDIIIVSEEKIEETFSNVYKIAIQVSINFDIIHSELSVRSKKDGDFYRVGGMTRKLKKLFNDRTVPPSQRCNVPVICDDQGILWVAGYKPRDGAVGNKIYLAICTPRDDKSHKKRNFYII